MRAKQAADTEMITNRRQKKIRGRRNMDSGQGTSSPGSWQF
jgi:hypothetical protein